MAAGKFTYDDFLKIINGANNFEIVGVLVRETRHYPDWHPKKTGIPTWTFSELGNTKLHVERTPYHAHYEKILTELLNDSRAFYLSERLFVGLGKSESVFNSITKIEKIVWNSLSILYLTRPDRFVSVNTPHNITWFLAKAAEIINIDIRLTIKTPLPWKTWIVGGLDEQTPIEIEQITNLNYRSSSKLIHNYIRKIRSIYKDAMPEYEKSRYEKYKGGYFDWRKEISGLLTSTSIPKFSQSLYTIIKKKKAFNVYQSYSRRVVYPLKYIVFFPHYQPERTTLPEGYKYAQQWLAIRSLAEAIPSDMHLIVKEHPSTFRYKFNQNVRNTEFYDAINSLPNVDLAPLEAEPFELIDRAVGVSTITGTVGVEALIRKKPVIVFGAAQYRGAKGVYPVKSISDIRAAIQKIITGNGSIPNDNELIDYFSWIDRNSFLWEKRINGSIEAFRMACTIVA